jgi:hypothetical protein
MLIGFDPAVSGYYLVQNSRASIATYFTKSPADDRIKAS